MDDEGAKWQWMLRKYWIFMISLLYGSSMSYIFIGDTQSDKQPVSLLLGAIVDVDKTASYHHNRFNVKSISQLDQFQGLRNTIKH